jgi:hypothetical protein
MINTGVTTTGLTTTSESIGLSDYEGIGVFVLEVEIPDIEDVTSVSIKFGSDLATDYMLGTVSQDMSGNALTTGVNILKFKWSDLTTVGSPDITAVTKWSLNINHDAAKPIAEGFKFSDLRISKPIYLNFKYVFYRVGTDASGADITEFTADTDIPFFAERYPQYKFAVARKTAAILFDAIIMPESARKEDSRASAALDRYKKNFSGERDMGSSAFKVAGVNLRGRRFIKRR